MNRFLLVLQDSHHVEEIRDVSTLVGEDASGSFSIWANHAPFMTILLTGLVRFRLEDEAWEYLALPGGLLVVNNNRVTVSTRRYFRGDDYEAVATRLRETIDAEEDNLLTVRASLRHMEDEILRRLYDVQRQGRFRP